MFDKAFQPVACELKEAKRILRSAQQFDGWAASAAFDGPFDSAAGESRNGPPVFQEMAAEIAGRPGKWMRPGLYLLAARAAREGALPRQHLLIAAALEMIQNASLLHDDVLDEAALRRHRPTANARWGNRAAVLFGDYLIATAFQLVAEAEMPAAHPCLANILSSLCTGEILQGALGEHPARITPREAVGVATRKTASFVAEVCGLGFAAGGGSAAASEALRSYGLHLGLAYQILDDVVDIVGNEEEEGKTLRTDLLLGRPTLALAYLMQLAPEEAQRLLPPDNGSTVEELAALMVRSGAVTRAMADAEIHLAGAGGALAEAAALAPRNLNGLGGSFNALLAALAARHSALAAIASPDAERVQVTLAEF